MNSQPQKKNEHSFITLIFGGLIFVYIFLYEPFYFVTVVDPLVRIVIESLILFTLTILWVSKARPGFLPSSFLIFPVLIFWIFNAGSTSTDFLGFITKIAMLVIGVNALQYRPDLAKFLGRAWAFLWVLVSIHVVLAAIGYYTGLVDFPLVDSGKVIIEETYFNQAFGYATFRNFLGLTFAKFSSYLIEPLFLGLFAGLNLLSSSYFVPKKYVGKFKALSLIAGLISGSITFYLFFISLFAYRIFGKRFSQKKMGTFLIFVAICLFVFWLILFRVGIGENSSLSDRAIRISIALNALTHSSLHGLLFGTYHYSQTVEGGEGISASCGLLSFPLQRGFIVFFPMMYLFYKYSKRDLLVVGYLLYYALALEYFWWPAFIIFLILFYCLSNQAYGEKLAEEKMKAGYL